MSQRRSLVISFAPLRASLFAALGLSAAACGGNVVFEGPQGSGGSGGSGPSTTSYTGSLPAACAGGASIVQPNGKESGYVLCPDGTINRAFQATCDTSAPACNGSEQVVNCSSDADCTDLPNGRCTHFEYEEGGLTTVCGCIYTCATDSDCGPNAACVCPNVAPQVAPYSVCAFNTKCATNDKCASAECGLSVYSDGCGYDLSLVCRTSADECRVNADCLNGDQCVSPYGQGPFSCETYGCAVGRPLLVEGEARRAPSRDRRDWIDPGAARDLGDLSPAIRDAAATHFREMAALEHASIASFARFTLELLALGAPPDLVADAQRAGIDEVEHAAIAYAWASAFAGKSMGPGALSMQGIAPAHDAREIVAALVREACVGETVGAAEALAISAIVEDPALAASFRRISEDEARHAELGWRTLAWLLKKDASLRAIAADTFDAAISEMGQDPARAYVEAPEVGLLGGSHLGALRRQALRDVVLPCVRGLLVDHAASEANAG